MFKEVYIKDGEPGWSVAVHLDGAENIPAIFVGAESTVWINESSGSLQIELFVSDTTDNVPDCAHLCTVPLGEALWQFANQFDNRPEGRTPNLDEVQKRLLDPVGIDSSDDSSVLAGYRETLMRALAYCDVLIEEA